MSQDRGATVSGGYLRSRGLTVRTRIFSNSNRRPIATQRGRAENRPVTITIG
jgi:hypothetical protein